MLTLNDGRSELWQWDTGRKLTVDADCTQVHFSNKVFGRSIDVDVVDGTAEIPDILLQVDKELHVWAFVGTAENGYTKISKVFKVNKRNKPADYVFTPTEQTTLKEVLERIEKLEEKPDAGVDPVAKTDDMTNPVGVDADGLLWTAPSGGGGSDLLDENGILKQEHLPDGFPYKSGEDVQILPGTTLTADPESGAFAIPGALNVTAGMRCKVHLADRNETWDVVCQELPENDMGCSLAMGNLLFLGMGDDTGEPFAIAVTPPEFAAETGIGGVMSAPLLAAESLTVSVSGFKGTFATMDPGYLPTVETVIVKVAGDIENDDYTTSRTAKEVDSLLRLGNVVMVEYRKTANELARDYYQLGSWLPDISASFYPIGPVQATEPRTIIANIADSDNSVNNWQAYYD